MQVERSKIFVYWFIILDFLVLAGFIKVSVKAWILFWVIKDVSERAIACDGMKTRLEQKAKVRNTSVLSHDLQTYRVIDPLSFIG